MQNRACGLQSLTMYSQHRANLGWLPMPKFIQHRTILTMFGHYLGEGILLQPPTHFGHKHPYRTRCSPWFVDMFITRRTLVSATFGTKLQCGGIHCHLIYLVILVIFVMACSGSSTLMTYLELFS